MRHHREHEKKTGNKTRTATETLEVLNVEWDIQNARGSGSDVKRIRDLTQQIDTEPNYSSEMSEKRRQLLCAVQSRIVFHTPR